MNGEREPGLSPNEQAIMEKELPGRSLLENKPELALSEKETVMVGDRMSAEIIENPEGQEAWRKDIAYVREPDPEREGEYRDTDEVKAVSETIFTRDEEGRITNKMGTNLDHEHSFEETGRFDKDGCLMAGSGKVTEGKKQGSYWEKSSVVGKVGRYKKLTVVTTGEVMVDGELDEFKNTEEIYKDSDGNDIWYRVYDKDGRKLLEHGKKPDDLEI